MPLVLPMVYPRATGWLHEDEGTSLDGLNLLAEQAYGPQRLEIPLSMPEMNRRCRQK